MDSGIPERMFLFFQSALKVDISRCSPLMTVVLLSVFQDGAYNMRHFEWFL